MIPIVAKMDEYMTVKYGSYKHTFFGLCELSNRTNQNSTQPIPVTITGTHKRQQVSLDDKKDLITWFRIDGQATSSNLIEDNDWGFGLDAGNVQTVNLRMVVAHKVELGETLIYAIAKGIPDLFTISGYEVVSLDKGQTVIDHDHETIYNTELGTGTYERHRFPWNLYAVNFLVSFIENPLCTADYPCCVNSIESEGEDCLILEP